MKNTIVISSILAFVLFACDSGVKPLPDGSIETRVKAISNHIKSVEENGEIIKIAFTSNGYSDATYPQSVFMVMRSVFSRFDEAVGEKKFTKVIFNAYMPTRDHLGNSSEVAAMQIIYNPANLVNAKWDNVITWGMPELAEAITFRHHLAKSAARAYCQDSGRAEVSHTFCIKAALPGINIPQPLT